MKKFKRHLSAAISAVIALMMAGGCASVREIDVTSCEVESVSPLGLRALECTLALGIHNPAMEFTVRDISGSVKSNDRKMVNFSGGPIYVEPRSDLVYSVPCKISIDADLTLFDVLALLKDKDSGGYVADVEVTVSLKNGLKKTFAYKDIPLQEIIGRSRAGFKIK